MDNTELVALREQILAKSREYFSESICNQWLAPLTVRALDDETLTLGALTDFTRDWVDEKYRHMLEDVAAAVRKSAEDGAALISPDCAVAPNTPLKQLIAMVEATEQL